jgi:uncharacterized protein involved in exopolysaccharide biosynthesis
LRKRRLEAASKVVGEGTSSMSLSHLAGVLKRRWIVVLVGVVLTLGAAVAAWRAVPSEYSSTSTMLLLPPVNRTEPGANPYLSLAGLTGPAEVVSRSVSDPATEQELRQAGASGTWTVERDYQTSAPIILITVQDSSVDKVRATSDIIVAEVPKALDQIQASINVATPARITSTVVSRDADVERVLKPLLRALMLVVAAGLTLTVAVSALIDAVVMRRRGGKSTFAGGRRRFSESKGSARHRVRPGSALDVSPSTAPLDEQSSGARVAPLRRMRPSSLRDVTEAKRESGSVTGADTSARSAAASSEPLPGDSARKTYAARDVHAG